MAEQRTRVLQIRMTPAEYDRVAREARDRGLKVAALGRHRVLGGDHPPQHGDGLGAPRTSYRCPRDCVPDFRPTSPKARCPSCRREVVEA